MEMPIKVMITLFVAIIVGFTVITFSRQIIERSKGDLERARPGTDVPSQEDMIIELNELDSDQTINLALECYTSRKNKAMERELCFIVIAKSVSSSLRYADVALEAEKLMPAKVMVEGLVDTDYALKIYYDPHGNEEKIVLSK